MMTRAIAALFVVFTLAWAQAAVAQMGKAPIGPGGVYGGFSLSYAHSNEPETQLNSNAVPSVNIFEVDPQGALETGAFFGYVFQHQVLGLANFRIEGSLSHTDWEDDGGFPQPAGAPFISADGAVAIGTAAAANVQQNVSTWLGSLALKGDLVEREGFTLPVGIEFFTAQSEEDFGVTVIGFTPNGFMFSNIETEYYGVMGVLEPELQISETFSIVARLAGGIYSYDFDGDFGGSFSATFSDSENGVGVRAEGVLGLKVFLSEVFSLTVFGGVDYWSETPIANFSETLGTAAFIDRTGLVKVKAGVMATIALGGQ